MKPASGAKVIVVLVTCPTQPVARRLAALVVAKRLAACVNLLPGIQSLFWWQGKVEHAREVLLMIKSTRHQFERLRRAILAHHPYEVPEIIAMPLVAGHRPYLQWVRANIGFSQINPRISADVHPRKSAS
jgi:periplasmic divalent cation tolerance protein